MTIAHMLADVQLAYDLLTWIGRCSAIEMCGSCRPVMKQLSLVATRFSYLHIVRSLCWRVYDGITAELPKQKIWKNFVLASKIAYVVQDLCLLGLGLFATHGITPALVRKSVVLQIAKSLLIEPVLLGLTICASVLHGIGTIPALVGISEPQRPISQFVTRWSLICDLLMDGCRIASIVAWYSVKGVLPLVFLSCEIFAACLQAGCQEKFRERLDREHMHQQLAL